MLYLCKSLFSYDINVFHNQWPLTNKITMYIIILWFCIWFQKQRVTRALVERCVYAVQSRDLTRLVGNVHILVDFIISVFVVVNFDALAQASDFRIERRQVVFLCWEQDSNPGDLRHLFASRLNACWQTDWAIEDQAIKLELDSPSLWSASIQPTWPHCHLAFAPGSGDIHICCC